MHYKKILALALACGISTALYAADTYDMGNVQVVGKDDQSSKMLQSSNEIAFGMTDKSIPLPDLTPEIESLSYQPVSEKTTIENIHRENKNEFSAAIGIGNRSSSEMIVNGKTQNDNYSADLVILRHSKDGYKSTVDSERTGLKARVTSTNDDTTTVTGGVEILDRKHALRGTNQAIRQGRDANAKIDDDNKRIWINSDSTLENGAFVKGYLTIDSLGRDTSNQVGFKDKQDLNAYRIGGTYKNRIDDKTSAKASIDIRNEKLDSDYGNNVKITKTVAAGGIEKELSCKATGGIGLKAMKLKGEDKLSPYLNFNYQPNTIWKISLGYEEDLGNDNLERIFLPNRYVDTKNLDFKASKKKTLKSSVDYRTYNGDCIGIDLFSQKEDNSIEYYDLDNFDGRRILSSRVGYADAERKGLTLRGDFKFEDGFTLSIHATSQNPEDENGNRLSYEPKRILDVGLNYTKNKLMLDFTRRAESGRKAYVGTNGGPLGLVGISDYTRSDLAVKYKINDRFSAYCKIKDLYDEAKKIRHDVSEEGRVTLGGIEMHF
jgi:hypothetical protein